MFRRKKKQKSIPDLYTCKSCKRKIEWFAFKQGLKSTRESIFIDPKERKEFDEAFDKQADAEFKAYAEANLNGCPDCAVLTQKFIEERLAVAAADPDNGVNKLMMELGLTPWKP